MHWVNFLFVFQVPSTLTQVNGGGFQPQFFRRIQSHVAFCALRSRARTFEEKLSTILRLFPRIFGMRRSTQALLWLDLFPL